MWLDQLGITKSMSERLSHWDQKSYKVELEGQAISSWDEELKV